MDELLSKEFNLNICVGKEEYNFLIKQATLSETIEFDYFLKQQNNNIVIHIFDILKKFSVGKNRFTEKVFQNINTEDFNSIFDFILKNYCKGFYNSKTAKKQGARIGSGGSFKSLLAFIIGHSNETLKSLKRCTWEEIQYISEGIVYNLNEQSEEGQKINKKNKIKEEIENGDYDETLERLKSNREKVMKKFGGKK